MRWLAVLFFCLGLTACASKPQNGYLYWGHCYGNGPAESGDAVTVVIASDEAVYLERKAQLADGYDLLAEAVFPSKNALMTDGAWNAARALHAPLVLVQEKQFNQKVPDKACDTTALIFPSFGLSGGFSSLPVTSCTTVYVNEWLYRGAFFAEKGTSAPHVDGTLCREILKAQ